MAGSHSRRGFTLVETLVVIACVLLLMAIALPLFLGTRSDADDARAKADVTNSLRSARAGSAAANSYEDEDALLAELRADNPSLTFISCPGHQDRAQTCAGLPTMDAKTVYVDLLPNADSSGRGEEVTLCALSRTQRFFCLRSNELGNIQGILDDAFGG